ncbi:MAG: serine hydrolase [Myxococcales bacterium]|nr:class A beta-lactamase-related serine hydrolase [Myxococcales bacterium]
MSTAGAIVTLEQSLKIVLAAYAAQTIAVAFFDFQTGQRVEIDARERMHAASTMKLAVLLAAHRLKIDLDQPIRVENKFKSLADGSEFSVDPRDDSDPWTYAQLGREVPLRVLLERMIVRSSNLATNLVMQRLDAARITAVCRELGAKDIEVLRGVEDGKAYRKGLNNTTTAHDLAVLLEASSAQPEIVELLARQEFNEGIPAGLPAGTKVAHKTGDIDRIYHDAALVYPRGRKPYVLVVMTRGFEKLEQGAAAVREISRTVWKSVVEGPR